MKQRKPLLIWGLCLVGIIFAGFGFYSDFVSGNIPEAKTLKLELIGALFAALGAIVGLMKENARLRHHNTKKTEAL